MFGYCQKLNTMLYYLQSQAASGRREGYTMIDINDYDSLKKITLYDLIDDATERDDLEALRWIEDERHKKITRTSKKDGTTYEADNPIISMRAQYFRKFLGYEPKKPNTAKAREAAKAKRQQEIDAYMAEAFKKIGKKRK